MSCNHENRTKRQFSGVGNCTASRRRFKLFVRPTLSLEPRLAVSARRYAASNAQDCKRSAASVFRTDPSLRAILRAMLSIKRSAICCEQCAGLQTLRSVRIKSGPDRFEPCLALSARRYAAKNATRGIVYSIIFADRFSSHWKGTKNGAPTT